VETSRLERSKVDAETSTSHATPTRTQRTERWGAEQRLSDLARHGAAFVVLWAAHAVVRGITAGDLASATQNAVAVRELNDRSAFRAKQPCSEPLSKLGRTRPLPSGSGGDDCCGEAAEAFVEGGGVGERVGKS